MPSMILRNAKTVWVGEKPWSSPDGKVTIWSVKLDVDGSREIYSTMSAKIAHEDFSGDVELYTNDKGKEYVRQAPKVEESGKSAYQDNSGAITASMAVKLAFQAFIQTETTLPTEDTHWRQIEYMGDMIYRTINNVKQGVPVPSTADIDPNDIPPEYRG